MGQRQGLLMRLLLVIDRLEPKPSESTCVQGTHPFFSIPLWSSSSQIHLPPLWVSSGALTLSIGPHCPSSSCLRHPRGYLYFNLKLNKKIK